MSNVQLSPPRGASQFAKRHRRRAILAAVTAMTVWSCSDSGSPLRMVEGQLALAPSLAAGAAGLVDVAQARIQLVRSSDSEVALDTIINVGADSIDISVTVLLSSSSETFILTLTLLDPLGAVVFQAGPIVVTATVATDSPPAPVEVPLQYVGPGSDAVDVQIISAPTRIFSGDTVQFAAVALDGAGTPIVNTPIGWRSADPTRAVVLDRRTGLVVGTSNAGPVQIEAFLLTGQTAAVALAVTQLTAVVAITPTTTSVTAGSTVQFTAEARDANDVVIAGLKFLWLSSNQAAATVDTNGLALGRADGVVTITAAAQGVPGNAVLTVTGGTPPPQPGTVIPTQIVFLEQPTNRIAGQALSPAVSVALQDASGTLATSATDAVTLSLGSNPGGATLAGTLTLRAAGGIASFPGISLDKVGTGYTLTATSGTFPTITSSAFDVSAAAADMLVFATQPVTTEALSPFNTTVEIEDAFGNLVPGATDEVLILLIGPDDDDAELLGQPTVSAVSGLASFTGLRIDRPGTGNLLLAFGGSLAIATSQTFDQTFTWSGVVVAGRRHNCGLQVNGFAYCWGDNNRAQLGPNSFGFSSFQPVVQVIDQDYVSLVAGDAATCGLTSAGEWLCWGELPAANQSQFTIQTPFPTATPGGIVFQTLAIGRSEHVCGITAASETYCWGDGSGGALGNGTQSGFSGVPVLVSGNLSFGSLALRAIASCALTTVGEAYCWGPDQNGYLGTVSSDICDPTGTPFNCNTTPTQVSGGITFTSVVSGGAHTCGLDAPGNAYCWGLNERGQLGTTTTQTCPDFNNPNDLIPCSTTPIQVSGGLTFTALFGAARAGHTCGLVANGDAYCWGRNGSGGGSQDGRLGSVTTEQCLDRFGNPNECSTTPLLVSGGLSWATLSLGAAHTCGVTTSNEPYCWGENDFGQLGNGDPSISTSSLPIKVIDP